MYESIMGCGVREIVERILQGKYEYAEKKLDFSTPRIELLVSPGETSEGSFTIFGPENRLVTGKVSSTDIRMEILTETFSGSPYEVSYRFNSVGLAQGDVLQGNFRIVSNQGEYFLPFVVTVRHEQIASSLGDIKNLFHFANLAKTDWEEAIDLFYSSNFISIFKGNDEQHESLYRGLSCVPGNEQNVEEFLIAISKKRPMSFLLDQKELVIDYTGLPHDTGILLTRNGWGYSKLKILVECDFVMLDKYEITEDDFTGSSCHLRLRLRPEKLHSGNNFGKIVFHNAFFKAELPVTVSVNLTGKHPSSDYQEKKKLVVQLVKTYENFRCKKITSRVWVSETGKIISKMNALDDKDIEFRLYTAQYYITAGRVNEGKWILDQVAREVEDAPGDELYSYHLYLTSLCSKEDRIINDVTERLEGIFRRNPDNWRIAWLLQYVSEEHVMSGQRKWMMIGEQLALGCMSPILYLEGMNILNEAPSILARLESQELSILEYGAKKEILSLNLIDQVVYLSARVRNFDKRLFRILKACYKIKGSDDVLEAIVSLLIKGGETSRFAFDWYAKGVERELRITRLYEYYMMSIYVKEDGQLPCEISKMVLMYFSYQSTLEYDKNAILYRYIHEKREEYPELYDTYVPQIERYLMAQLDKGRVGKDLGYLYKNLLTKQMVDASNASKVLAVLYTSEIRTDNQKMCGVSVIYDKCEKEMRYPMSGGRAFVPLYGSDYTVLLVDHDENRYAVSVPYSNIKMMIPGKLSGYAIPYIQKGRENLDLFLCDLGKNAYTIDMENVGRYKDLAESEFVKKEYRNEIQSSLVRFYYDNDFTRQLTEYLININPIDMTGHERNEIIELMVLGGLCNNALEWMGTYGTYGIDAKIVLRMCDRLLDKDDLGVSAKEIEIAYYAFSNGKYDEQLLKYLEKNFTGTVKEMRDIWKAAEAFGIDTYSLSERMLLQMLYSGSYIGEKTDIFKSYVRNGANADVEMAFLSLGAYDYFVHGSVTDRYVFERIEALSLQGLPIQDVCKLAYLRYYATEKSSEETVNKEVAEAFIKSLMANNIYFPFYLEYSEIVPGLSHFADKTMLEYRTEPGTHCHIHYRLAGEEDNEYHSMELHEMYEGIYVCAFVLFFGEQLQYYITEDKEDSEDALTESGTIQKSDITKNQSDSNSRYSIINDIMIGETLQDYDTVDKLLAEYHKKNFVCNGIFKPIQENSNE